MPHYLLFFVIAVLAAPPASSSAPAGPTLVADARRLILEGYYPRAEKNLDEAAREPGLALPVALARVAIDERLGRYRKAIERLNGVKSLGEKSAEWHAALAAMQIEVGEYDAAIASARAAIRIDENNTQSRFLLGRTLEILGRYDEAATAYKWFEALLKKKLPARADDLTYAGRGFLRYSTLTRSPEIKSRCKYVLQEVYQEAFDFVDSSYWPARLASADLLLEKHNLPEATEDFGKVRSVNAQACEAEVGMARVAMENWNFDLIDKRVRQALEINPNCVAAFVAQAQGRMLERRYSAAGDEARKALKVNPRSIDALSMLAVSQLRLGDAEAFKQTQQQIASINPHCAVLQFTLAYWLSAARQYEDAAEAFNKAIEYAPWWSEPRTELGLMYMQSGQERESRRTLDASWELDPYNRETYNVLALLDELEQYAQHETEHFIIRYDADKDGVLVPFLAAHLEKIHAQVCDEFRVTLKQKTMIEVFPEHTHFSVRISGRPWIATVGACTGPVIAIDAPRTDVAPSPFNWADVLHHEFTHTVTLAATGNRIPHWMTEGLSVHQQLVPRSWDTMEQLAAAMRTGRLFTMETIDWGFMRPQHPDDRSLAYAQSEWMIEYITQRWGHQAVLDLLNAYKNRETQAEAYKKVLKVDTKKFIVDFMAWAKKQIASWGLPTDPIEDIVKLKAAALLRPGDATARARVAEAAWYAQDWDEVDKQAHQALEIDHGQPLALRLLGALLVERADEIRKNGNKEKSATLYEQADRLLRRLRKAEPHNTTALQYLARIEQAWNEPEEAAALWAEYLNLRPRDPEGYRRLAALDLAADHNDKALPLLERLYQLDPNDADTPHKVAKLQHAAGKAKAAAVWMQRCVEIVAYDADVYLEWGRYLREAKEYKQAQAAFEAAKTLSPEDPHPYEELAKLSEAQQDQKQADKYWAEAKEHGGGKGN